MDKDAHNKNYYSSSDMWMREIGSVRDDLAREQKCSREYTGEPPCSRLPEFEGPSQCLAYDLSEDRILVAGHASRDSYPLVLPRKIPHRHPGIHVDGKIAAAFPDNALRLPCQVPLQFAETGGFEDLYDHSSTAPTAHRRISCSHTPASCSRANLSRGRPLP